MSLLSGAKPVGARQGDNELDSLRSLGNGRKARSCTITWAKQGGDRILPMVRESPPWKDFAGEDVL